MTYKNRLISYDIEKTTVLALLTGCFMILAAAVPGRVQAENLDDAFKTALARDYTLKSADYSVAAAEEDLKAAKAHRLPSVRGQASYTILDNTPSTSFSLSPLLPSLTVPLMDDDRYLASDVTVSVPVFTSFRISQGIDAARAAALAGRSERQTVEQDIKLNTARAYVSVLRAQHARTVAQSNVMALTGHARDVENAHENGLVPKNDVLAVRVALADARQLEIKANNALALARAAYNRQLGRPLDSTVILEDLAGQTSGAPGLDGGEAVNDGERIQRALENRPELRQLDEQSRALSHKAKSIRASALPQVQVSGSYNHLTNTVLDEETIWSGSVGVRWDLFDGGVIRHQARSEDRKRAALDQMKLEAESLVRLQVRQACLDVQETAKRIAVTQSALDQAEENLAIAKNRYTKEMGSNTEVLDAETLRINSIKNHDNAVYDLVMAKLRLKRATGDL